MTLKAIQGLSFWHQAKACRWLPIALQ